jgi:GH35 family endo-1,4-beta-xylanase
MSIPCEVKNDLRQATRIVSWVLSAACLLVFLFADPAATAQQLSGEQILREAPARIERYRMGDGELVLLDREGKPIRDAVVHVQQKRHAFLFGCNIFLWGRIEDPQLQEAYLERFAALLNYATLPFYWPTYEPVRGNPGHDYAERVARWCQDRGIVTKGHPLAWNYADPRWLPEDPEEIFRLQLARIDDCVRRFRGLIDRWDVVNEATHFDREEFLKRAPRMTRMWQKIGQVEFTRACFIKARQASENAVLIINDYRTDPAYERLIEQLVDESGRRLYDVIGIQSHMHGGVWPTERIWEVCERFARFGVPLHFTETTIVSGPRTRPGQPWKTTPEGEEHQAREVERFYTVLFSHPAVEAITWWDFSDLRAWQGAPAGLVRADMSPKPAYDVLLGLVKGKWWTDIQVSAAEDGRARFRGFFGDYRVVVRLPDGTKFEREFALLKGKDNQWVIRLE